MFHWGSLAAHLAPVYAGCYMFGEGMFDQQNF
jgi:hypothetical protein